MSPDLFAARAEALVGTPFRLHGRELEHGLDCVGLVSLALGGSPAPTGYGLRNSSIERHLAFVARSGFHAAAGAPIRGDLLLVDPDPAQHHLLIAAGRGRFIHAHAGLRRVAIHEGALGWPIAGHWRLPPTGG